MLVDLRWLSVTMPSKLNLPVNPLYVKTAYCVVFNRILMM